MEKFLKTLKRHIAEHPPNFGDGESVLTMLYECHNENNPYDNDQIAQFASTDCPFRMSGAGSSVEAVWVSG